MTEGAAMRVQPLIAVCTWCALGAAVHAADLPGSKDPPDFKRFEGSEIIHYATNSYEQYFLARDEGSIDVGFNQEVRLEVATVHVVDQGTVGTSPPGIFR